MKTKIMFGLAILLICSACSVQKINQDTRALEDSGFLQINGDLLGKLVQLNSQTVSTDTGQRFALKSGSYELVITDAGKQIIKRTVFISSGQTVEVSIP